MLGEITEPTRERIHSGSDAADIWIRINPEIRFESRITFA